MGGRGYAGAPAQALHEGLAGWYVSVGGDYQQLAALITSNLGYQGQKRRGNALPTHLRHYVDIEVGHVHIFIVSTDVYRCPSHYRRIPLGPDRPLVQV
jgi:hypothetical protein